MNRNQGKCTVCCKQMRPVTMKVADAPGTLQYGGRGLCKTCARRARSDDSFIDHQLSVNSNWDDTREDLLIMMERYPTVLYEGKVLQTHKHQIAGKLGIKWASLYQSLRRHNETELLQRLGVEGRGK